MYSVYGIEENDISQQSFYNFIWYLKRNNIVVNFILIVC